VGKVLCERGHVCEVGTTVCLTCGAEIQQSEREVSNIWSEAQVIPESPNFGGVSQGLQSQAPQALLNGSDIKKSRRGRITWSIVILLILGMTVASTVMLTNESAPVSKRVPVPSLVGQTQSQADHLLRQLGLTVGAVSVTHSNIFRAGLIISTSPSPGVLVPEHSAIKTVVSSGPYEPVVTPPTNVVAETTSEQKSWPLNPRKCGPSPVNYGMPFSPTQMYQVTGTVRLWSGPTIGSRSLDIIPVTEYGAGGIGCPTPSNPTVQVICKTMGDKISGPFGADAIWEKVRWNNEEGFVSDEWLNTQWDSVEPDGNIPWCR
jgi:hypothetical protein